MDVISNKRLSKVLIHYAEMENIIKTSDKRRALKESSDPLNSQNENSTLFVIDNLSCTQLFCSLILKTLHFHSRTLQMVPYGFAPIMLHSNCTL